MLKKKKSKLIWFHAASIGEFKSIIPIIKELNKNKNFEFLITTTNFKFRKFSKRRIKKI